MKKALNGVSMLIVATVIFSNIASFFLGGLLVYFLTKPSRSAADIVLRPISVDISDLQNSRVYASSNGKRYYPWWCDAGKGIAEENVIWFDTPDEAGREGYTLAKGCA